MQQRHDPWANAVVKGDAAKVALLLSSNPHLLFASVIQRGTTALHVAASKGHDQMMERLISAANAEMLNKRDSNGLTCLQLAAAQGHNNIVVQLLATGHIWTNATSAWKPTGSAADATAGWTALHFAVGNNHPTVVETLLAALPSASLHIVDLKFRTVLHLAVERNLPHIVEQIVGACPNLILTRDSAQATVLHFAANEGFDEVVARLLATGQSSRVLEARNKYGCNALDIAASKGHSEVVAQLIAASPTLLTAVDSKGLIALHRAVEAGQQDMVTQLLAASPASINHVDSEGLNVLHRAAFNGDNTIIRQLLAVNPGLIHANASESRNALYFAISEAHSAAAELLLDLAPQLARFKTPLSSLHFAISRRCSDALVAKLFKLNPQDLQALDKHTGRSPFHMAIQVQNNFAIDLLQWHLSLHDIEAAFAKMHVYMTVPSRATHKTFTSPERFLRYQPIIESQCEVLWEVLSQDVALMVFGYVGCEPKRRDAHSQTVVHVMAKTN